MKFTNLVALLVCITLIFSQNAFATRLGGGKSYGMQRSVSTNSGYSRQQQYNAATPSQGNYRNEQQQRSGMGTGTAAALGAAAGAAGGYLLGRSMNNNGNNNQAMNASNSVAMPTQTQQSSTIPWGIIGILVILLFVGLMFFRKSKASPGFLGNANMSGNQSPNSFMPNLNRMNTQPQTPQYTNAPQPATVPNNMDKMPDGIETMYFIRQVKGMFLHIQSMNNTENVAEIEKYMTPNLYQEISSSISTNQFVADFSNLDCQLLNCEVNGNQLIASVKFFGMVSDEPNQPSKPFSEIWNFVKTDMLTGKWLVAGIQQETLA